ncbi:MAG: DUF4160 domain-containing protein [Spirochaetia bacterium]|nr:DUF4160 domain-containing protein [Spirochaetia bacterium]MBO7516342.1 DUF4160 domain-containing protein [Spirochaetia bacterium]
MSEISSFLGISIYMFFDNLNTPHFHALYKGVEGLFFIPLVKYERGKLPPGIVGLVKEWAELHKKELLENWSILKATGSCQRIEPLV